MGALGEIGWMLGPLVICLVLTGIHGYLGIHVLARKVIFVDLAMAQIAALGATYAYLLGYDSRLPEDKLAVYFFSLGFTLAGAGLFALTRMRREKIAQEAFIGITYVSASAIAMLVLSKSTGEGEHLKHMLVGNVLLITWPEIVTTTMIYSLIGAFHWFARKEFFLISDDPERALEEGLNIRLWDFLFYVSFGVVITSSVSIAGVLLVFSYLVVPAVIAVMFAETVGRRIAVGWLAGAVASLAGMIVSYYGDLPTGPAVVTCFAALLMIAGLVHTVMAAPNKTAGLARVAAGAVVVSMLVFASLGLRKKADNHQHDETFEELIAALSSADATEQFEALDQLGARRDADAVPEILRLLQSTESDRMIEHMAHLLPGFEDQAAVPILRELASDDRHDVFLRLSLARAILELEDPSGLLIAIAILTGEENQLAINEALQLLREYTGQSFGFRPGGADEENRRAVEGWRQWWSEHGPHLVWRQQTGAFS